MQITRGGSGGYDSSHGGEFGALGSMHTKISGNGALRHHSECENGIQREACGRHLVSFISLDLGMIGAELKSDETG